MHSKRVLCRQILRIVNSWSHAIANHQYQRTVLYGNASWIIQADKSKIDFFCSTSNIISTLWWKCTDTFLISYETIQLKHTNYWGYLIIESEKWKQILAVQLETVQPKNTMISSLFYMIFLTEFFRKFLNVKIDQSLCSHHILNTKRRTILVCLNICLS